jgi:hypothetical protein
VDTFDIFLKVKKEDVAFVCSIIEECEGMATLRTPDPKRGEAFTTLKAMVSPEYVKEFRELLAEIGKKTEILELSA